MYSVYNSAQPKNSFTVRPHALSHIMYKLSNSSRYSLISLCGLEVNFVVYICYCNEYDMNMNVL